MNVVFSILHYQALDMTCKCVESILKLKTEDGIKKSIVIVDNNSPNDSGKDLKKIYEFAEDVHIVLAKSNLGFAKGNNIGYTFAKQHLDPSVIVVINNDIIIRQDDFIEKLLIYTGKADVLAPDIINLSGIHQNPMRLEPIEKREIERLLLYGHFNRIIMNFPIINKVFLYAIKLLKKQKTCTALTWKENKYGIVPHGAALIFCARYIQNEDIAFIADTFMFCEEDILYDYLCEKNYEILYTSELQIVHYEDVATDVSLNSEIEKRKFMFKHKLDSLNILKQRRLESGLWH